MGLVTIPGWPLFRLNEFKWLEPEIPLEFRKTKKDKKDKAE